MSMEPVAAVVSRCIVWGSREVHPCARHRAVRSHDADDLHEQLPPAECVGAVSNGVSSPAESRGNIAGCEYAAFDGVSTAARRACCRLGP